LLNLINFKRLKFKYQKNQRSSSRKRADNSDGIGHKDQSKSIFQRLGRLFYVKDEEG